jgi:chemotaxis-related protein WspB
MLVLTFRVGPTRFALPAARVRQVVPRVALAAVAGLPKEVEGLLELSGDVVPVVDLGKLLRGVACDDRLGTRIIVARTGPQNGAAELGLVAEDVTDLHTLDSERGDDRWDGGPPAGGLLRVRGLLMQWLNVDSLLPSESMDRLFASMRAAQP